jgi:hypothetical protein
MRRRIHDRTLVELHAHGRDTAIKHAPKNETVWVSDSGNIEESQINNSSCGPRAQGLTTAREVSEEEQLVHRAIDRQMQRLQRHRLRPAIASRL